jgi:hypothetical protein
MIEKFSYWGKDGYLVRVNKSTDLFIAISKGEGTWDGFDHIVVCEFYKGKPKMRWGNCRKNKCKVETVCKKCGEITMHNPRVTMGFDYAHDVANIILKLTGVKESTIEVGTREIVAKKVEEEKPHLEEVEFIPDDKKEQPPVEIFTPPTPAEQAKASEDEVKEEDIENLGI